MIHRTINLHGARRPVWQVILAAPFMAVVVLAALLFALATCWFWGPLAILSWWTNEDDSWF